MFVPECEAQQRVYFSSYSYSILENDSWIFSNSDLVKIKLATFLNNIIENYYKDTNVNFQKRYNSFKENNPDINEDILEKIFLHDVKSTINDLKKFENKKYLKNKSLNFRLQNNIKKILSSFSMPDFIKKEFPDANDSKFFLDLLFEEYCSLPIYEREKIYFKNKFIIIKSCIKVKKRLHININGLTFIAFPIYITTDSFNRFNYLVCYSKKTKEKNDEYKISSFRLSRIDITDEEDVDDEEAIKVQKNIKKLIAKKDMSAPEFLNGDIIEIKVSLTDIGKKKYRIILHNRPHTIKTDGNTYYFKCTELQALSYFSRFGNDALIIEPRNLKDKMCKFYMDAYETYK